jgi:peptidoglycan hydrolase-like protein with peptidoglycan-binding domain
MLLRLLRDGQLGATAPAAPTSPVAAERILVRFGDHGDDVRQLQLALQDAGAEDIDVDGIFGPKTDERSGSSRSWPACERTVLAAPTRAAHSA